MAVNIYGRENMFRYADHREGLLFSEEDRARAAERTESLLPKNVKRDRERDYDQPPPPGYICHTCGEPGHFRQRCPVHFIKRQKGL